MLRKLMKYDLKWIYKLLIIFYALTFAFSIIGRICSNIESTIFQIVTQFCYGFVIGMVVNVIINNLIRVWVRFHRNIYKDEAYLTHTLPVEKRTLYLSKFLSAIITMFTTIVVIIANIAICYYSPENLEALKGVLEITATTYNSSMVGLILIIFGVIFIQMSLVLLVGYTGIILGYKSNNGKMGKSFLYGFIIYAAIQVVTLLFIFIAGLFNQNIMNLFTTTDLVNIDTIKTIMYMIIILYVIYITAAYIINTRLLKKSVNID